MITPRSAPAFTTCGFTLLAIALVAATIHVTAPDYAGVRAEMVRENGCYWMNFTGVDGKKLFGSRLFQRKNSCGIAKKYETPV
jgi:hypothetical protein